VRATGFMTTEVLTLHPQAPVKAAAAMLVEHNIASAPVVLDDGTLVGMVSELDLLEHDVPPDPLTRLAPPGPDLAPLPRVVADVMTPDVVTLPPEADAALFLRHMLLDRIVCVPVVAGGRVLGVVSRRDLLRLLARPDPEIARDVQAALAEALPGDRWRVTVVDGLAELRGTGPAEPSRVAARIAQSVPGVLRVGFPAPDRAARP
jgi:CBS domain-containing protein